MSVAYDSPSQYRIGGGGEVDTGSWTHTLGGGVTNGYVLVWMVNTASISAAASNPCTVNGSAATPILGPITSSYGTTLYLYGCATGVVTGAITIAVAWAGSGGQPNTWAAWAGSASGAAQSPTWSGTNSASASTNSGANDNISTTLTTPVNGLQMTGTGGHFNTSLTASTGTQVYNYADGSLNYGLNYGTANTQTWAVVTDNASAMIAAALSPAAVVPSGPVATWLPPSATIISAS